MNKWILAERCVRTPEQDRWYNEFIEDIKVMKEPIKVTTADEFIKFLYGVD